MRHIAPSGTPIKFDDLSSLVKFIFNGKKALDLLTRELSNCFGTKHAFFLSTGRAAMVVLLEVLKEKTSGRRDEVVIPAYTCFSVPSSIVKAGLKVRVCDVDPLTLDYDYEALSQVDFSKVMCVCSANLYGIPNNLKKLEEISREKGVFLIDDSAQSMGALFAGRYLGTFGDAGIFSLDKGKVITSINGGIIVTNSDSLAEGIQKRISQLDEYSLFHSLIELLGLVFYVFFLSPSRYWIPAHLPFLSLGKTIYTTAYPLLKYDRLMGGLTLSLISKVESLNEIRRNNGLDYERDLCGSKSIKIIAHHKEAIPIYLRYPVLMKETEIRNQLLGERKKT